MIEQNQIYNIDCEKGIELLENNSINLMITSPPYNVDLDYDVYNDKKNYNEYILWLKNIFIKLKSKMTNDGRLCLNVGNLNNGSTPLTSDIIQFMKEIEYGVYTTIIWNKNHTSCRTAWGSWLSPSQPSFPTTFEFILIFYNKSKKLIHKEESDLTKEEFINYTNPLWVIKPVNKNNIHPAMFPKEIPYRLIKMFSYKNDVVLDLFNGSGTTCFTALELNRKCVGFEISEKYYNDSILELNKLKKIKNIFNY